MQRSCAACGEPLVRNADERLPRFLERKTCGGQCKLDAHRGERIKTAKLTAEDVRQIRARLAAGDAIRDLAETFGVSFASIWNISTGRTWKHVG